MPNRRSDDIMAGEVMEPLARRSDFPGRWVMPVVIAAATVGVAARLAAFFAPRSLWLDEAMLACNICGRGVAGLLRPLDDNQAAPVGFLLLSRLAVAALGASEASLRLVPLVAVLASLALVYRLCRTQLGPTESAFGLVLAAFMPAMIYYGAEAKQYAVDLAVGLLVPALVAPALRSGLTFGRGAVLAAAGAAVVWLSHPSLFVLAAAGLAMIAVEMRCRGPRAAAGAIGVSACWAASFLACYALTMRNLRGNAYLENFWREGFLAVPPRSAADLRQYVTVGFGIFEAMYQNYQARWGIEGRMAVVAASAWLAGVLVLVRRREFGLLALLTLPLLLALAASAAGAYPMRVRMTLFACGPSVVVMAAGLGAAWRSSSPTARALGLASLFGLVALPAMQAASTLAERRESHGARPVLAGLALRHRAGDVVIVDSSSEPTFRFYRVHARLPGLDVVEPTRTDLDLHDPEQLAAEARRHRGRPRVWLIFSDHLGDPGGREARFLGLTLDADGPLVEEVAAQGYRAELRDFSGGPADPPVPTGDRRMNPRAGR